MSGFVDPTTPNITDYTTFIRAAGIGAGFLPDDSFWIPVTFGIAQDTVNITLACAGPTEYTLAVYNLGVDRLFNFAIDVEGQTFFQRQRRELGLMSFASGLVSSSSDSGTAQTLQTIEAAKRMTITDLQLAKTIWGRTYLGFAQNYGPTIWGLT